MGLIPYGIGHALLSIRNMFPLIKIKQKYFRNKRVYKSIKDIDPLITEVFLFDLYQGKHVPDGKKSMAYSIRYQAHDRTLREEEVSLLHEKVLAAVKDAVGGAL